jgi:transposase
MITQRSQKMNKKNRYEKSFKEEAVKLAEDTSVSQAAQSLGLHENTLRNWIRNSKKRPDNPFIGSGHKYIPAEEAEKAALLKENRELKRANEILKEALGFFAASQKK